MKYLSILCLVLFFTSCAGIMNPELKQLKTKSEWLNPSPHVRPVSDSDKKVYVSVRNTSGSDMDIRSDVKSKLRELGYQVTGDLKEANFILMADLRYFGVKSEKGYANTIGGAVIGGATGAVIGSSVSKGDRTKGAVVGGIGGAALGGLIGNMVDGSNKVNTLDIVVDLRIGEKIAGGVNTKVSGKSNRGLNQSAKAASGSGHNAGKSSSGSNESVSFTREEDFYYHEARLVCSATKINLTEDEARDPLQKRLSNTIGQILP